MPGDYEVNNLIRMRQKYRGRKDSYAYTYTRLFLSYASRLIFALGWNELRDTSDRDSDALIYDSLFQRSTKSRKDDSIEPGEYAHVLSAITKEQSKRDPALATELNFLIHLLREMGQFRNEYMHVVNTVGLSTYLTNSDKLIKEFNGHFMNKECDYLIPLSKPTARGELECVRIRSSDNVNDSVTIPVPDGWKHPEQKLFYRIRDSRSGSVSVKCLSPFISFGTVSLIENAEVPHFWIYEYVATRSYSGSTYPLRYTRIFPTEIWAEDPDKNEPIPEFMSKNWDFQLSDLFRDSYVKDIYDGKPLWYQSHYNSAFINISSYPGFENVVNHQYAYCEDICPQRTMVMNFCKDDKRQCMYIFGNGGIGKTALMLSVLNELFNTKQTVSPDRRPVYNFTHLIFLSAKRGYYYHVDQSSEDGQADICDYAEFLKKLSSLLEVSSEESESLTEDIILSHITATGLANRYLLIIDDLDSLPVGEQEKIEDFINKTDPKLLKTIVTTRFIYPKSNNHIMLNELTTDSAMNFAKWHYQKCYEADWNAWSLHGKAENLIRSNGKGNPLRIMRCIELVRAGLELMLTVPASRREEEAYFYNTVQNILNEDQKKLFEICRQLYINLPDNCKTGDMPVMNIAIPRYLCVGLGMEEAEFERAFQRLQKILLVDKFNNWQFRLAEDYLVEDGVVPINSVKLPPMYNSIQKELGGSPDKWNYSVEQTLYELLTQLQRQSNERTSDSIQFEPAIVMRIFECMRESGDASQKVVNDIDGWIQRNAITGNPSNFNERLIQAIENDWAKLKKKLDCGERDARLQSQFQEHMADVRRIIQDMPQALQTRYRNIVQEYKDY